MASINKGLLYATENLAKSTLGWATSELSRYSALFQLLSIIRQGASGDLQSSSKSKLALKVKEQAESKYAIDVPLTEIQNTLDIVLKAILDTTSIDLSPLEVAYRKILRILGVYFLTDNDAIMYVAYAAARRIQVLCTFEKALLNGLDTSLDQLQTYMDNYQALITTVSNTSLTSRYDTSFLSSLTSFYSSSISSIYEQVDQVEVSSVAGTLNPTSIEEIKSLIQQVIETENIQLVLGNGSLRELSDPSSILTGITLRVAYIDQVHQELYKGVSQWIKILAEYAILNFPSVMGKEILETIKAKLLEHQDYFDRVAPGVAFSNLTTFLTDLVSIEQAVDTLFSSGGSVGSVDLYGHTTWIETSLGGETTYLLENPLPDPVEDQYVIKVGDKIAVSSPTLDSDGHTVAYHTINAVTASYLNVSPAVTRPADSKTGTGNEMIDYVIFNGGSDYYGKYYAISEMLSYYLDTLTTTIKPILLTPSETYVSINDSVGKALQTFIGAVNSPLVTNTVGVDGTFFEDAKDKVKGLTANLAADLEAISDTLAGFILPDNSDLTSIDDILSEYGLTTLRSSYVSGRVLDFFGSGISGASEGLSLLNSMNQLVRSA